MKAVLILGVAMLFVSTLSAGTQNDAGCGWGSMLFKNNGKEQILAATTNGFLGSQTFGITSGTAGCGESAPAPKPSPAPPARRKRSALEQESFIASNMRNLSREMASGQGEYVSSLASLLGCSDASSLGQFTQSKYETLFPSQSVTPTQLLQTLKSEMSRDARLSQSCTAL